MLLRAERGGSGWGGDVRDGDETGMYITSGLCEVFSSW